MAKIKNIEKRIWDVEGFGVRILTSDGRDVRGDLSGVPQYYTYEKAAKNDMTVESWKATRFRPTYPGFDGVCGMGSRLHIAQTRQSKIIPVKSVDLTPHSCM